MKSSAERYWDKMEDLESLEKLFKLEKPDDPEEKKKKRKKRWILLSLLLVLLIAAGAVLFWYFNRDPMDAETRYWFDKMAADGSLENKTDEELRAMLDSIVDKGMFNVSINARPVFESGKEEGNLAIENVEANYFYCAVTLIDDETGDVLYQSQGIKPGQYIEKVTLEKSLSKGEYNCTAVFTVTDPDTLEDVGEVNVKVVLTILN